MLAKRRRNEKPPIVKMDNPSHQGEALMDLSSSFHNLSHAVLSLSESDLQSSDNSSLSPYHDYCRVNIESRTHTQPQETTFTTVANGEIHDYYELEKGGIGQNDYTVIYEDPTSSYVVGVRACTAKN